MAFNSDEYAWKDLTAVGGGRVLAGLTKVKHETKLEREYVYGKGNAPRAIQDKNIEHSGELEMLQSEYQALVKASPNNDILKLTLDNLTLSCAPAGGVPTTDQLCHVKFTSKGKEMTQGDGHIKITLPFMFLDIKEDI